MRARLGNRTGSLLAVLIVVSTVAVWSGADAITSDEPQVMDQVEDECLDGQLLEPQVHGIRERLKDDGRPRELRALLLLDGVTAERAEALVSQAGEAYRQLDILLTATYRPVALTLPVNETDPQAFIDEARRLAGGSRPSDVDVVHLLTVRNMAGAGYSSCVGGVAYPTRAFSTSEELKDRPPELTSGRPIPWPWGDTTAITLAHEIGHLMGGEHVLANCVEGLLARSMDLPRLCTVMDPSFAMAMRFSTINGAVVRGYASAYLRPI